MSPNAVNPLLSGISITYPNTTTYDSKALPAECDLASNENTEPADRVGHFKCGADAPYGKSGGQGTGLQTKAEQGLVHSAYAAQLKGLGGELAALLGKNGSTSMTSGLSSRWAEFVGSMALEKGAMVDINALVQAVLREAYMENTKDLHFYAQKVRHFNELKKLIRNHLTEMRDFQVKFTEFYNGLKTNKDGDLTKKSQAKLAKWLSQNSSDPLTQGISELAKTRTAKECMDTVMKRIEEKFGITELPKELRKLLQKAFKSGKASDLKKALSEFAGFLAYLGDCGVKDGVYGKGGCNDMPKHYKNYGKDGCAYAAEKAWKDFDLYKNDPENAAASHNLHKDDIALIEEAFSTPNYKVDLGINKKSSWKDVVAAAMGPVSDAWANEILLGMDRSTRDINKDVAKNGYNSETAIEIFGSKKAAQQAFRDSLNCTDEEYAMRVELGMIGGVPPAGCDSPDALDNEIQKWEEKLNSVGDDAQLANVDLQNMLQKQQQTLQMLSNISKTLHDTAMSVIRKIGG